MRAIILTTLAVLASSTSAFATKGHTPTPPVTPPAPTYSSNADASASSIAAAAAAAFQAQSQKLTNTNTANGGYGAGGQGGSSQSSAQGGQGGSGGSSSASSDNRSRNNASAANNQTINANSYQAKQRLQAPGIAASFSSVSGNPCEGAPTGVGLTGPGFGGLFQFGRESTSCVQERKVNQGVVLMQAGLPISPGALVAIYAGVPADQAIRDNPYIGRSYVARARTVRHAPRGRPCVPCGGRAHH